MNKIKVIGVLTLFFGLAFTITYFVTQKPISLSHAKLDYYADNVDKLIVDSSLIIEGVVTKSQSNLSLEGVSFVQSKIIVKDVLKGDLVKGSEIYLLQTKIVEDPIVGKSDHVLLFLEKYSGPVTREDAYVSKGLFQGHYKIKNDTELVPSLAESNKKLSIEIKNNTLNQLKEKIKKEKVNK
jgi:hypothetical protein